MQWITYDSGFEIAIFSGPRAHERAIMFAERGGILEVTQTAPPISAVRTDPEERTLVKLPSGEAILRTFKRLVIGLLAVGLAHSEALPGSAATTLPDIRGIYIVAQKGWLDDGQLAQAIAVPGVDGILVYVLWSVLTSAKAPPKTYNWTVLDQMVQLAVSNGKKFEVGIVTGRDTPAWVFDAPPQGLGAAGQTFGYVQLGKLSIGVEV